MGYYLYDARGYVGDLASTHGLQQVSEYVRRASNILLVKKFFDEGHAPITEDLMAGLRNLHPEDIEVAQTIDNLLQLLVKCDSIANLRWSGGRVSAAHDSPWDSRNRRQLYRTMFKFW